MISVQLIDRETVAETLQEHGCVLDAETRAPFEDHAVWITSWGDRFFVPHVGPDQMTAAPVLAKILEDLARFRPGSKKTATSDQDV